MAVVQLKRPAFGAEATATAVAGPGTVAIAARSTASESPSAGIVTVGFGGVALAAIVVAIIGAQGGLPAGLALAADVNAFALFYVAAQGIERLLEPFTFFVVSTDEAKKTLDQKKAEAVSAATVDAALDSAREAADQKATLQRLRSERAILFWALATVVGIAVSAWLGLHFLAAILAPESRAAIPPWVDVVATGLVIGGGTKALHDLITRLSKRPPSEEDESS